MCGINGFTWGDRDLIRSMNASIAYRGPDDTGILVDRQVSLGHNRLSIVDLSKAGHQPMSDDDGRFWIVYNGEIYNHVQVRKKLEQLGCRFNSDTDTEVIIYAYREYGKRCLNMFNGMFAFAIWDSEKKELFLARDRLGIKPLYYMECERGLVFSSELKSILDHEILPILDLNGLNSFLTYRFIPSDQTMLRGIMKLEPGHYAQYKSGKLGIHKYWDISWRINDESIGISQKKVADLLKSSVERRLMADVPLGAFLSGGLDSSLIASINSRLRPDAVKTFTVGWGHETDEFAYARKVSEHLGTDHHELVLDFRKITSQIPKIIHFMDEPNSDISMVPLYFLSQFAKQEVTVVNTGEGADEIFSGYYHYYVGSHMFRHIPSVVKAAAYRWYYSPFKGSERKKLIYTARTLKEDNTLSRFLDSRLSNSPKDMLNRILHFDIKHELPNWQLPRVDRMTMAHAVEARVPFLDHKVVEFASTLPARYKQPSLEGKHILKKLALSYLPKDIIYRKKQGFTTPMHAWMKENLEDLAEHVLLENRKEFIDYTAVRKLIDAHRKSDKPRPFQRYSYQLMVLLFFDIWYEHFVEGRSVSDLQNQMKI